MAILELTVKQRIQLHLFDHSRFAEAYEAPMAVTQSGIAKAVGIRVHHVTQYVRPLLAEGLLEERTSHIQKRPRRRKVYFLTGKGREDVASLRDALLREDVDLRRPNGMVERVPLSRVYQEVRRGETLLALVGEALRQGYIAEAAKAAPAGAIDFATEAPRVDRFYGREGELRAVLEALATSPVVVVSGLAGIGKTTLAAKACEALRGSRSLFWRQIRPWDTGVDLVRRVAEFLTAHGRSGLLGYLVGHAGPEWGRIEELLRAEGAGLDGVLVFDDVQRAAPEAESLLALLHRALRAEKGLHVLLLSRTVPTFYTRRDVEIDGSVVELPLKGLDTESGVRMLEEAGIAGARIPRLVAACGGVPLFLKLVAQTGRRPSSGELAQTLETYIAEELDPSLEPAERDCLEVASLFEMPVPAEALLLEERARRQTLSSLTRKGLLERWGPDGYGTHEFLRMHFRDGLSQDRRAYLAGRVIPWLDARAEAAVRAGRPLESIEYLGNAVHVDPDPARRRTHLEEIGDLRRLAGDTGAAVEAFRTALGLAAEPGESAMLHQKIAAILTGQGHIEEAAEEIQAGLRLLPGAPSSEAGWLLLRRAQLARVRRDPDDALAQLDRVTTWMSGRPADPALWAELANLRGIIYMSSPGHIDVSLARREFQEAVEGFEAAGDRRGLCRAYNNLGWVANEAGEPDEAIANLDRSAAIAKETGDVPGLHTALQTKAWALSEMFGDYEGAEALYTEAYRIAKATQQSEKARWLLWHFAQLYRRQGRFVEAREALEYFSEVSEGMLGPEGRLLYVLTPLVRLCLLCGDLAGAERYLRASEDLLPSARSDTAAHVVLWARGATEAGRGDTRGAREAFDAADELTAKIPHHGEFCLEYGRFLAAVGERGRARDVLSRARDALSKLSLAPLRRQAESALLALRGDESPE